MDRKCSDALGRIEQPHDRPAMLMRRIAQHLMPPIQSAEAARNTRRAYSRPPRWVALGPGDDVEPITGWRHARLGVAAPRRLANGVIRRDER